MQERHFDDSRPVLQEKKWREFLERNHLIKRLLLLFSFLMILTCFLHFSEVRLEILEIGTKAPRYVISQADFTFMDDEATQTLRQEAIRDIGTIYKVEESQVHLFRRELENTLIENQKWRQELPRSTFEEVYTVLDKVEEQVIAARFTDDRTLSKMKSLNFSTDNLFPIQIPFSPSESIFLSKNLWKQIKSNLSEERQFHSETIDYLVTAFSKHSWLVQQDFSLERSIREQVQSTIPERYTHVDAGAQILKKGEKVSPRHIAMLQAMKNALAEARNLWTPLTLLGSTMVALCLVVASLFYLHYFHRDLLKSLQKMTLLVVIIVMSLGLAKGIEWMLLYESKNLIEYVRFPVLLPFTALLITVLIGSEIAMVISLFLLIIFDVSLTMDSIPFLLINLFAILLTVLFAKKLHKRKEVFSVCAKVWIGLIPMIIAFNWIDHHFWNFNLVTDLLSSFVFLSATAILAVGLLPILESLFSIMTDMTLMEYMDPDHALLRRLSLEAPGTYQHCLVVGNLAESAARCIGANGLFCRVATLYHDIGKLFNPHYFTENQLGGFNIHQLLTPVESTHVIIAHVPEGEALARKYHLPQSFIDIIREHHGTTMVYYFYCKQVEQMDGDATKVNEKMFRYPGPRPRSKESAIIMIADTVEAASRSMDEVTEESIDDMVDKLVAEKAEDGQFDECQLTFEELGQVKKAIVKALMVTRHLRIKYPQP